AQATGLPPTQLPATHESVWVQALPSLHGAVLNGWVHAPAPLQTSSVQPLVSAAQRLPLGSKAHVGEQQSPAARLWSSQSSPAVTMPLPHAVTVQFESQPSPSSRLPSSHASAPTTMPSPHTGAQADGSPGQLHPASVVQDAEHPSPATRLPSSHVSLARTRPSP